MPGTRSWNPIAFVPAQVSIIVSAVYIALFAVLIWIHHDVPAAPSNPTPDKGINLTQAWLDLDAISNAYHPYNSHAGDKVRGYLLGRVEQILEDNGVEFKTWNSNQTVSEPKPVTLFAEDTSNLTFVDARRKLPWTCYTESENILVYIRGKNDDERDFWSLSDHEHTAQDSGVLVNAHYDSVSSGFGATDDGVGVATVLQLISYFTTEGQQPRRGIVALLNSGEEDGLYGAHSFVQHPLAKFPHTFLNLEGAGAGGRAMLFRSTDAEITQFYAKSPYPMGQVVSADGFKRGLVRSSTDYGVFTEELGMRGLDVAFFEPRARYHTSQDDARDTSPDSLWHMLSASLATVKGLASYRGNEFEGSRDHEGRLKNQGTEGVWFDLFGRAFALMQLPTLFALCVTLLAAAPLVLIALEIVIARNGKWYPFSRKAYLHSSQDDEPVLLNGFRGFFRFPIAFVGSGAAVVALGYLLAKINPHIIYSSEYAVWTMMLTAWTAVAWFLLAGADRVRPTALQRFYCLLWMYVLTWIVLVLAAVGENNLKIASGYFALIYNGSVFFALLLSYLELLALPKKSAYVEHVTGASQGNEGLSSRPGSQTSRTLLSDSRERGATDHDEATESTSLLRGGKQRGQGTFLGFGGTGRQPETDGTVDATDDPYLTKAYGDEQAWSSSLPQWTWIVQFIVLGPINIVIVGQLALLLTSALHQTLADGNPALPIYLFVAGLSVLLLMPATPFLHRFPYQIPTFLFLVFIGCLLYNMFSFPFSRDARMKYYFVQHMNLDNGTNNVVLAGLDGYVQDIIAELPSAAGQDMQCGGSGLASRNGLQSCTWPGLTPSVVPLDSSLAPYSNHSENHTYRDWLELSTAHDNSTATLTLRCANSKAGVFVFDEPVSSISIADGSKPQGSSVVAEGGTYQIHLFSRTWEKTFELNVTWEDGRHSPKGKKGRAVCLWSDANQVGTIPAFDELRRYQPVWSAVTKMSDGLVEGWREFEV